MPSSRFSGLYLSARTLSVLLVVVGVMGAMALFRARAPLSNESPLQDSAIAPLLSENQALEHVATHVAPAVVRVQVTSRTSPGSRGRGGNGGGGDDNPLSQFFQQMQPRQQPFEMGVGSGVILSPDGYIVTNNHVVEGATDIQVYLSDGREFPGKVVGTDALTDLAAVKINVTGLPNLPWGDSKALKQGDTVFAFGNPFGILHFTMTRGIVSGLGRPSLDEEADNRAPSDFIQTDAAINPGNSGGPLVDARGQVIGINAFIISDSGSFNGAGFAIPSEIAQPTVSELIAHGKVVRGYMGIGIQPMDPSEAKFFSLPANASGALVSQVDPDTPAAKAGLQVGDLITAFNGKEVADSSQLQIMTGQTPPGTHVTVGILREGKAQNLSLTLGTLPDSDQSTAEGSGGPAGGGYGGGGMRRRNAPPVTGPYGIQPTDLTPDARSQFEIPGSMSGALVQGVRPGSAAYNAGLSQGDLITEVNRHPVSTAEQLLQQLDAAAGTEVLLRVWRGGSGSFLVLRPESIGSGGGNGGGGR